MMGFNNIELISDRPIEVNLREISEVKKRYPKHAVIASLMVESKREVWHDIVKRSEDAGADGLELNFGCPHGMSERGMGSAVGQVPEYACMITEWVKEAARTPVLVKLTPNISDIRTVARAAKRGRADGLSAINTINSITGIDLDTLTPRPNVGGYSSHGGYCGPAVKPIALNMVQQIAADPEVGIPISGIGGVSNWRDAAEFILLGCGSVQVCTAAMHYGYRMVEDLIDGLANWMDEKGFATVADFCGLSVPKVTEWKHLDLNYKIVARISASISTVTPSRPLSNRPAAVRWLRRPSPSWTRLRSPAMAARRRSGFRMWTRRNASAAICAGWFAPWKIALRWSRFQPACHLKAGSSAHDDSNSQRHSGDGARDLKRRRSD
jgi:dihydropyrimidine dehydrogenase (NAD+) subunit PreA